MYIFVTTQDFKNDDDYMDSHKKSNVRITFSTILLFREKPRTLQQFELKKCKICQDINEKQFPRRNCTVKTLVH